MKIKFQELNKIREVFMKLTKLSLPIKISYPIAKFMRETDGDMNFYCEELNKIISTYRDSSDKDTVTIQKDKIDEFNSKIFELDNQEIEVNKLNIDLEVISEKIELTIEDMYWLSPIIE